MINDFGTGFLFGIFATLVFLVCAAGMEAMKKPDLIKCQTVCREEFDK